MGQRVAFMYFTCMSESHKGWYGIVSRYKGILQDKRKRISFLDIYRGFTILIGPFPVL